MSELLSAVLRDVSRSFYLTLRILPSRIRPQIGLAYLLARTTDTIADTELIPLDDRLRALNTLRCRISGESDEPLEFGELARRQGSPAERRLLERAEESLALLASFTPQDIQLIRSVLEIITSGQELDLRRFAAASAERVVSLQKESELDDYTWRVAGCVGEFWTKLCRSHIFHRAKLDDAALLANGILFGKGLQLVNILRDLPVDLRHGRCYLPAISLAVYGLTPEGLLNPANRARVQPLYLKFLKQAENYLAAGWTYTNTIPRRHARVRLACAWPLLIGRKTTELLRARDILDPTQPIKISRSEVKRILWRSILAYPWPPAWNDLFQPPHK